MCVCVCVCVCMCGGEGGSLLWQNKSYQVQARGGGLSLSVIGSLFGLHSLERQKHWKNWLGVGAHKSVQDSAPATRGV